MNPLPPTPTNEAVRVGEPYPGWMGRTAPPSLGSERIDPAEGNVGDRCLRAVLAAVADAAEEPLIPVVSRFEGAGIGSKALLAVLVYSYLTETYSSQEIERMLLLDAGVRALCGMNGPDAWMVRRFRRLNGSVIIRVLAEALARSETDPLASTVSVSPREEAEYRVRLAITIDREESEE